MEGRRTVQSGIIDQDISPRDLIVERLGDRLELSFGIEGEERAAAERLADAEVAVVTSRIPVTRRVLERSSLEIVAKLGTGIDNVDLAAARESGVAVTHTPGINALSVAEHTLGLLLAVHRRTVAGHRTVEAGEWRDGFPPGRLLSGSTVGIVGLGNIGRRVASLLRGFDVTTLAYDPYVDGIEAEPVHAELTTLGALLDRSDVLTVNAELTGETRGMIDRTALERLGPEAVLVNTARGRIVDEDALLAALQAGDLAGAGLDVFAEEPLPADSPLHDVENVVMTPHVGGATRAARRRGIARLTENVRRLLDGGAVPDRYLAT